MTQTMLRPAPLGLAAALIPCLEADLRYAADIFDASFWPPRPFDPEFDELLMALMEEGSERGVETSGLEEICLRFGVSPREGRD